MGFRTTLGRGGGACCFFVILFIRCKGDYRISEHGERRRGCVIKQRRKI